jgi:hypothetical protein
MMTSLGNPFRSDALAADAGRAGIGGEWDSTANG